MTKIEVSRLTTVAHGRVWGALADLGSHSEWMKDAQSVEFTTDQTTGLGTALNVETHIGPFRTVDALVVTGWDEGRSVQVAHTGLVRGRGILAAGPVTDGTLITWTEDLTFPWFLGGPVTAWLAKPVLKRVMSGNLARLEELLNPP